ncbi:MAG: exodeoxyribonuclease VII large subunit [Proteobacteria bacterium]|nr:exodeoxyribonuclease VII large subunit [Pseudomonadota bacterium]
MRKHTVTSLNAELDRLLGSRFAQVLVEGEIGQLQTPSSGHAYLTLRHGNSILNAVMWRTNWVSVRFRPRVGDRVLCRGRIGIYGPQGRYQLYVNVMKPAGEGDLAQKLEAIKARLDRDGLLDPRRKRPLPKHPRFVGVATSSTGAALQDFLKVSGERFPATKILVAPCFVQGPEASAAVIRAMDLLIEDGRAELIVVTRGGGSKGDLLPFHDEQLARFIASSPIPVVSAVGHQIDTTMADLVADAVAPTPSAAALLVLPDGPALTQRVDELEILLRAAMQRALRHRRRHLESLAVRLRHPQAQLTEYRRRLVELSQRMVLAMGNRTSLLRQRLQHADGQLLPSISHCLELRLGRLKTCEGRIAALSPFAVLDRGYAIATGARGVITNPAQVALGESLDLRVAGGSFPVVRKERN